MTEKETPVPKSSEEDLEQNISSTKLLIEREIEARQKSLASYLEFRECRPPYEPALSDAYVKEQTEKTETLQRFEYEILFWIQHERVLEPVGGDFVTALANICNSVTDQKLRADEICRYILFWKRNFHSNDWDEGDSPELDASDSGLLPPEVEANIKAVDAFFDKEIARGNAMLAQIESDQQPSGDHDLIPAIMENIGSLQNAKKAVARTLAENKIFEPIDSEFISTMKDLILLAPKDGGLKESLRSYALSFNRQYKKRAEEEKRSRQEQDVPLSNGRKMKIEYSPIADRLQFYFTTPEGSEIKTLSDDDLSPHDRNVISERLRKLPGDVGNLFREFFDTCVAAQIEEKAENRNLHAMIDQNLLALEIADRLSRHTNKKGEMTVILKSIKKSLGIEDAPKPTSEQANHIQ